MTITTTKEEIFSYLNEVLDPEVPALSIIDLGIVREVEINENGLIITITPTYTGCPAMQVIEEDIISALKKKDLKK